MKMKITSVEPETVDATLAPKCDIVKHLPLYCLLMKIQVGL